MSSPELSNDLTMLEIGAHLLVAVDPGALRLIELGGVFWCQWTIGIMRPVKLFAQFLNSLAVASMSVGVAGPYVYAILREAGKIQVEASRESAELPVYVVIVTFAVVSIGLHGWAREHLLRRLR